MMKAMIEPIIAPMSALESEEEELDGADIGLTVGVWLKSIGVV